ncbi:hypothetical protein ONZ45_g9836 [Pleurotus djamor]|nr:hypothetical protein ONZ45_g9836 [Pleurotus djamor]
MADPQAPIPPEVIVALTAAVKEVFLTVLIGYVLATALYGITVTQTFLYFRNYAKDHIGIKLIVVLLWALDTSATALVSYSLYSYLVKDFGKPVFAIDVIPRSFAAENGVMTGIIFITQSFFAYQIWIVSRNKSLTGVIVVLSIAAFGKSPQIFCYRALRHSSRLLTTLNSSTFIPSVDTNTIYENNNLQALDRKTDNIIRGTIKGLAALADILMAGGLIFYFRTKRTGVPQTEHILDKLVMYAASRGSLAAFAQIIYFIVFTAFPQHVYWQPVHQIISKLYVNSVLASLNARSILRSDRERAFTSTLGTTMPMHPRTTSNGDGTHTVPILISKNIEQFGSSSPGGKYNEDQV